MGPWAGAFPALAYGEGDSTITLQRVSSHRGEFQGFLHFGQERSQDHSKNRIQIHCLEYMTIYVGNLAFDAEAEDVQHLFGEYGTVRKCSLPLDRETGRKRGFAFVEMSSDAEEAKAIDDLQNVEWMGRSIRVNKAEPRPSGGGRSQGGGGSRW
jgi:RNA recognition motif-containing protein